METSGEEQVSSVESAAPAPAPAPSGSEALAPLPAFVEDFDPDSPAINGDAPFDYQALLEADPFAPKKDAPAASSKPGTPAPQVTPTAPGAGQVPAGQAQPKPAVPPAGHPAPSDPRDLKIRLLEEQMSSLRGVLDSVSRSQQPAAPQPEQAKPVTPQIETPAYNYNIPDAWVEGLNSEDPNVRKTSLSTLLQGVSQVVHRETIQQVRKEMQEHFTSQIPSQVQQVLQVRDFNQRVEADYYGKFGAHANFRPLVAQLTKQVFDETGAQGWSPEIRDTIGARVQNYLQAAFVGMQGSGPAPMVPAGVQAPQAPVQAAQAQGVPKAPHVFGGIASPGVGMGAGALNPNSPDGIAEALSF